MQNENKKENKSKNFTYQVIANFIENITGISIDNLSEEEEKAIATIVELISLHGASMFIKIMAKAMTKIGTSSKETSETERVMKLWANNFRSKGQAPLVAIGLGSGCNLNIITPLGKEELRHVLSIALFDLDKFPENRKEKNQ